ncbi:MAG: PAS domain S-box protein [Deltaproteobacteria bacterium]|nr:PAS domain S-box protein [Deltaproteobacteria bacterium]
MSTDDNRFKEMVEGSQDWFWEFDENAIFTYASPRIRDLLGYEPDEIIGLNAFDLMSPEEALRVRKHFDPIAKKYEAFNNLENTNIHKDGHEVVVESSGTPFFDETGQFRGYRGIDRDITSRKQNELALKENQALLKATKKMANLGSWQMDLANNHLTWSDETYRIFGVDRKNFVPSYEAFLQMVHPDDQARVDSAYSASLSQDGQVHYDIEHRIVKQDTVEIRYVHQKCKHQRNVKGDVLKSFGIVQDITERKRTEIALLAATESAEAANNAKSLFLAKLSHEIRTPLTTIVGFGELLEDAELSSEHKKYLSLINSSSRDLTALIEDVLDLAKIEEGKIALKKDEFNIFKFLDRIAAITQTQTTQKGLSFKTSIAPEVPELVIGDRMRIKQVLLNLLGNAIKFTEAGSIEVMVSLAEKTGGRMLLDFAVKDTGIGISDQSKEHVFEPFYQSPFLDLPEGKGVGLGLAISRSLATLMGGSIRLDSQQGVGSTFHFLVPLLFANENKTQDKKRSDIDFPTWQRAVLHVLLVDDNPNNIEYIKAVFEKMGHDVTVAENGKVAFDLYRESSFDLVLLDIDMPVMDGPETLKMIRSLKREETKLNMIIAQTAYAFLGDREKFLQMGFDGYLSKPFTTKELAEELTRILPGSSG